MIRFRPLPVMSVFTIASLIILVMLGNWQWSRYQEKLAARGAPAQSAQIERFTPLPGNIQLVYVVHEGQAAWRVFTPVSHDGQITFLDTGMIPGLSAPDWRAVPEPFAGGEMAIKGVPMVPHKASFAAAKPDPAKHLWYSVDLAAMGHAAGLKNVSPSYLALPYVGPDGALTPNPFASAQTADPLPPERHLGYALTWWGLAGALLAVYAAFHIRAGRLSLGRQNPGDAPKV